jgi:hypothetical protein
MSDPNINASARSVSDKLDGEVNGQQLNYRLMALLHECSIGSLRNGDGTYPYPEGPNTSSSLLDGFTTLAKIVARTNKNDDLWDAVMKTRDQVEALAVQVAAIAAALKVA